MKDVILDYVRREFVDPDAPVAIDEKTRLISSGLVDSFSMVSLKCYVERRFGVLLPDAEATPRAFDTVESIVALVDRHRGKS